MSKLSKNFIAVELALIITASLFLVAGCGTTPSTVATKKPAVASPAPDYTITPKQALAQFEKTHQKFSSVQGVIAAAPAALKSEVRVPKDSLGATLLGSYLTDPDQPPDVTLSYSNNMAIEVTEQATPVDYAGQAKYFNNLNENSAGGPATTHFFVTTVHGYQAIAEEHGQNSDGSSYGSFVAWSANGTQHMVSSDTLHVADVIIVANSMY